MSEDVIGEPIIGDVANAEPLVVKLPPVVMQGMALTTLIEHGMRQSKLIQDMLMQATFALERARAASNDGTGAVLKMIIPVMIHRKQYLAQEIQMWALVMGAAESMLDDIKPELDEIDRINHAKETTHGGDIESDMVDVDKREGGNPCGSNQVVCDGRCATDECVCPVIDDEIPG